MVDVYTVSRMLKSFRNGLPSQLSVSYLGANHTKRMAKILEPYYDTVIERGSKVTKEPEIFELSKCI